MSGSSAAGCAAAAAIGAIAVEYPSPTNNDSGNTPQDIERGIRVGIIARPTKDEAWKIAYALSPMIAGAA